MIRENKMGIVQMDLQSTIQIRNRYSNVHSILIFLKEENNHRELIKGKFNVYVWIKDSVNDLLAVKIGDNIDSTESKRECKKIQVNFIDLLSSIFQLITILFVEDQITYEKISWRTIGSQKGTEKYHWKTYKISNGR